MNIGGHHIKLKTKLKKHNNDLAFRNPLKTEIDLPMSSEMMEILDTSLNVLDSDGCLPETVASNISDPLSSMAVYCPSAAVMASNFTAQRGPSPSKKRPRSQSGKNTTASIFDTLDSSNKFASPDAFSRTEFTLSPTTHANETSHLDVHINLDNDLLGASTPPTDNTRQPTAQSDTTLKPGHGKKGQQQNQAPPIDEAKSRLEVLWLRRRAELAKEDGQLDDAVNFLQEAVDEHLGGRDYHNANLSQPILSNDPHELLGTIEKDYFMYDPKAHRIVAVIQRWYLKHHLAKCALITKITKLFRGYKCKKAWKKIKEERRQCAVLVQRRFRIHLRRMNALATFLKSWYKMRRQAREFQKVLRLFRLMRRIQSLWRGIKGRKRAAYFRLRLDSCYKIQHNGMAYVQRRDRAFVLTLFHRKFWLAARTIQNHVRKIQAVERAQTKLLLELSRENIRSRKERIVVEEALRMQRIRNYYYLKSPGGNLHFHHVHRQIQAKKKTVKDIAPELTEQQLQTQRLITVLEQYDEEGTGNFNSRKLKKILKKVLIPVNKEQLIHILHRLDPDETDIINIADFIEWYYSEDADKFVEPDTLTGNLTLVRLELRRKLNFLGGATRLYGRARKAFQTQEAAWLAKESSNTFRGMHAPKYQCCQCRQAFTLFTDYFIHFEPETGVCGVTHEKALFFPKYWIQDDWLKQRAIENEIMRTNDEHPYVRHHAKTYVFASLAAARHSEMRRRSALLIEKAYDIYKDKLLDAGIGEMRNNTIECIVGLLTDCEAASISDIVADSVIEGLSLPWNSQWIAEEFCTQEDLKSWIQEHFVDARGDTGGKGSSKRPSSPGKGSSKGSSKGSPSSPAKKQSSLSTAGEDAKQTIIFKKPLPVVISTPALTEDGTLKQRARMLARVQVDALSRLHAETQSSLFALLDYRSRKPRRLTVQDAELEELELFSLTSTNYHKMKDDLTARLKRINEVYIRLYSRQPVPKCVFLRRMLLNYVPPVGPDEDINLSALFTEYITTVHSRARGMLDDKARSAIGSAVLRRLGTDLKISKHRLLLEMLNEADRTKDVNATSAKIIHDAVDTGISEDAVDVRALQFVFGKYCSIFEEEGLDPLDLDLLAREFSLYIPTADQRIILGLLDPDQYGSIYFPYFLQWMKSTHPDQYRSTVMYLQLLLLRALHAATRTKYYHHAKDVVLARQRALGRMETSVREGFLLEGVDDARVQEVVLDFYGKCESGQLSEGLNARKYHIMTHPEIDVKPIPPNLFATNLAPPAGAGAPDPSGELALGADAEGQQQQQQQQSVIAEEADDKTREDALPLIEPLEVHPGTATAADGVSTANENAAGPLTNIDYGEEENVFGDGPQAPYIRGDLYDNLSKLYTMKWREEENENRVIYNVVERRAERRYLRNIFSSLAQYNLFTERRLMVELDNLIDSCGYCLRNKKEAQHPDETIFLPLTASAYSVSSIASGSFEGRGGGGGGAFSPLGSINSRTLNQDGSPMPMGTMFPPATVQGSGNMGIRSVSFQGLPSMPSSRSLLSHPSQESSGVAGSSSRMQRQLSTFSATSTGLLTQQQQQQQQHGSNDAGGHEEEGDGGAVFREINQSLEIQRQESLAHLLLPAGDGGGYFDSPSSPPRTPLLLHQHYPGPGSSLAESATATEVANKWQLYQFSIEMMISVFDTDCTGDLDEGEVRILLKCLHCSLSETAFRHAFADADDVIRGVSVAQLVNHLKERTKWKRHVLDRGIAIQKIANIRCALRLLVSLQRQLAHKRALQTVKLSKVGRIVVLRDSQTDISERTRYLRSQVFAMRQVTIFLRTIQGSIKLHQTCMDVAYSWNRDVASHVLPLGSAGPSPPYDMGIQYLRYAYAVHHEGTGVLMTEVPHVVKFLLTRMKLIATKHVSGLTTLFGDVCSRDDIRILTQEDFIALLPRTPCEQTT